MVHEFRLLVFLVVSVFLITRLVKREKNNQVNDAGPEVLVLPPQPPDFDDDSNSNDDIFIPNLAIVFKSNGEPPLEFKNPEVAVVRAGYYTQISVLVGGGVDDGVILMGQGKPFTASTASTSGVNLTAFGWRDVLLVLSFDKRDELDSAFSRFLKDFTAPLELTGLYPKLVPDVVEELISYFPGWQVLHLERRRNDKNWFEIKDRLIHGGERRNPIKNWRKAMFRCVGVAGTSGFRGLIYYDVKGGAVHLLVLSGNGGTGTSPSVPLIPLQYQDRFVDMKEFDLSEFFQKVLKRYYEYVFKKRDEL